MLNRRLLMVATMMGLLMTPATASVTASITNESVDELKLAKGNGAIAVIKASDVMVGVD
jgi:molybdopterin-binding protein